ncbi:MAG TPA: FAD-binding protein [Polyangiaceae bacterium]|nr:FAD-binding protein [Polyangiaceae bacterium]
MRIQRRHWLQAAAALCVTGFDPKTRSWIAGAQASSQPNPMPCIPGLMGQLLLDSASVSPYADDFGHIVHRAPLAVLRPACLFDVVLAVRFARAARIPIAMRGQGHCQLGEAQVQAGIVVDSSTLSTIHALSPSSATVDAGVTWSDLVLAGAEAGATPPVLTDYLGLSVGGTLSVGGVGGAMHAHGLQADNVLALWVVTGKGDLVECSEAQQPELFRAVLTGLGQFGLIVRAKLRMVPAPSQALVFNLYYDDIEAYVTDQTKLVSEHRFSYLEGQVTKSADGLSYRYMIEAVQYFEPGDEPDAAALVADLAYDASTSPAPSAIPYLDFAFRLEPVIQFLKQANLWGLPHPWLSLWVPASKAASYVQSIVANLSDFQTGQGPILFYPVWKPAVRSPLYRLPEETVSFAFNILRTAIPGATDSVDNLLASNRALYDQLVALGGTRFPIGAIPFSPSDWRAHFGADWPRFERLKRKYDPQHILTPGQRVFA